MHLGLRKTKTTATTTGGKIGLARKEEVRIRPKEKNQEIRKEAKERNRKRNTRTMSGERKQDIQEGRRRKRKINAKRTLGKQKRDSRKGRKELQQKASKLQRDLGQKVALAHLNHRVLIAARSTDEMEMMTLQETCA